MAISNSAKQNIKQLDAQVASTKQTLLGAYAAEKSKFDATKAEYDNAERVPGQANRRIQTGTKQETYTEAPATDPGNPLGIGARSGGLLGRGSSLSQALYQAVENKTKTRTVNTYRDISAEDTTARLDAINANISNINNQLTANSALRDRQTSEVNKTTSKPGASTLAVTNKLGTPLEQKKKTLLGG